MFLSFLQLFCLCLDLLALSCSLNCLSVEGQRRRLSKRQSVFNLSKFYFCQGLDILNDHGYKVNFSVFASCKRLFSEVPEAFCRSAAVAHNELELCAPVVWLLDGGSRGLRRALRQTHFPRNLRIDACAAPYIIHPSTRQIFHLKKCGVCLRASVFVGKPDLKCSRSGKNNWAVEKSLRVNGQMP